MKAGDNKKEAADVSGGSCENGRERRRRWCQVYERRRRVWTTVFIGRRILTWVNGPRKKKTYIIRRDVADVRISEHAKESDSNSGAQKWHRTALNYSC